MTIYILYLNTTNTPNSFDQQDLPPKDLQIKKNLWLRGCVQAVSRRLASYEFLPFVIVYVMTLHPWKRTLHELTSRRKHVLVQI